MRLLPIKLKANVLFLCQEMRNNHAALYRVMGSESGPTTGWEIWKIRTRPEKHVFGKTIPAREVVPQNEDFGKYAWSWCSREQAEHCFQEKTGAGAE
jgi:hypothetical protein